MKIEILDGKSTIGGNKILISDPEEQFSSLLSQIKGKVGEYVPDSKKFVSATQNGSYITVVYDAKFTQEDSVKITISFEQSAGTYKITGLYFNSPKLQGK